MRIPAIAPVLALAVLVGLGSAGCSKQLKNVVLTNQPPTVRLTFAPIDTTHEEFYVYKMNWVGYDPDGRVVRFEYCVDPPNSPDAVIPWVSTTKNEQTITFTATKPESLPPPVGRTPRGQDFHVFAIRAVDNLGMASEPIKRAFYSFGVAPVVQIDDPRPSHIRSPVVSPAVRIRWSGKDFIDPNGFVFEKPVQYKFKLFKKPADVNLWSQWQTTPDSLRLHEAPAFAGWDSTGPDSAEARYTSLTPNSEYIFVVVAIGRSGVYSPVWDLDSNMLKFYVGFASQLGPQITLFNSFFSFSYVGGFPAPLDPSWAVQLQVPAGQPITFNWSAVSSAGAEVVGYRWVQDLVALDDETPRRTQRDVLHWSPWNLNETAATIGPFQGAGGDTGEVHNFFLEAKDINGLVSLGWVQLHVFRPTFDKDLLIVDDTRFQVDQILSKAKPDTMRVPSGVWPTRAELDTFLFATGGVRWKMTPQIPQRLSPPGIFRGYRYDTLGTRYGFENPTTSLGLLGQYRHVVWMTDQKAVNWLGNPTSTSPMTVLRYMSMANRQNTLATWVSQGGQLWGLGGGFGHATNDPWNNLNNDMGQTRAYRFDGTRPDLTPGRFMFDLAHWRSEFRVMGPLFVRFTRFDQPDPTVGFPRPAKYWKGGVLRNPDYAFLPTALQPRDPVSDPIWPNRQSGDFFVGNQQYSANGWNFEFLAGDNFIQELVPVPGHADSTVEASTLDSLYLAWGNYPNPGQMLQGPQNAQGVNVAMTYYHGLENAALVFSGTSIWDFRRQDCQGLVDFVLGHLWGMSKNAAYASSGARTPGIMRRPVLSKPQVVQQPPAPARPPVGISTIQRRR